MRYNNPGWPPKATTIALASALHPQAVTLPPFIPPPPYHPPVLDQMFPAFSSLSHERLHAANDLSVLRQMVKNRKEQIQLLQAIRDLDQELSKLTHLTHTPNSSSKSTPPPSKSLFHKTKKSPNPVLTFPVSLRSGASIPRGPSPK